MTSESFTLSSHVRIIGVCEVNMLLNINCRNESMANAS